MRCGPAILTGAALSVACIAPAGLAEGPATVQAAAKVNTYVDNDGNTIVTPVTAVRAEVAEGVEVGAHAALDIMTCASVDVVSAATPKGYFQETRQEYAADLSARIGLTTIGLAGVFSRENDYQSFSGSLSLSTELFARNTTLALGYSFTDSDVGRAGDPSFDRDLDSHTATLTLTQMLSAALIGQLSYFVGVSDGFMSSPYRAARLRDGTRTPERAPDHRVRHAAVGRLKVSLSPTWFGALDYRLYADSWGMVGHSAELAVTWQATPWLALRLRDRFHRQSAVDFYQSVYDLRRVYLTADRELGGLWSNLVGFKLTLTPHVSDAVTLAIDAKADVMVQTFDDFAPLPERRMFIAELGLRVGF